MNGPQSPHVTTLRSSLSRNVVAMYVLQFANYLIPFVTLPYLIRTLSAERYGEMAMAYATVFFMVLFVDSGFNTVAARRLTNRSIGLPKISRIFLATQLVKLIQVIAMWLLLLLILLVGPGLGESAAIYLATFPIVLGSLLFPTWLFQGLEIMHFTTAFSVGGRLVATAGIFIFVSEPDDVALAAFFQASGTALSGLLAIPLLYRRLQLGVSSPWRHLVAEVKHTVAEARSLAPAEFLSEALNNSGVFLLGLFASDAAVGIFAAIEKIAKSVTSLFQPLLKALFPALSGQWMRCEMSATAACRGWSFRIVALAAGTAVCMYVVAPRGLEFLFGAGWSAHATLLQIYAAWLFLHVAGLVLGQFWLLARGERSAYARWLAVSGAVQLLATLTGAWSYGAVGLVTALACSELVRAVVAAGAVVNRRAEYSPCAS